MMTVTEPLPDTRMDLDKAVRRLAPRAQWIVCCRVGGYTLKEIGVLEGVSSARVRQIEQQAYRRIRAYLLCRGWAR